MACGSGEEGESLGQSERRGSAGSCRNSGVAHLSQVGHAHTERGREGGRETETDRKSETARTREVAIMGSGGDSLRDAGSSDRVFALPGALWAVLRNGVRGGALREHDVLAHKAEGQDGAPPALKRAVSTVVSVNLAEGQESDERAADLTRRLSRALSRAPSVAPEVPRLMADVTAAFIESALRESGALPVGVSVKEIDIQPMALNGFLSDVGRAYITYECSEDCDAGETRTPPSVIVKLCAASEEVLEAAQADSLYRMEAEFFLKFAETCAVGAPHCFCALEDDRGGHGALVLEDLELRPTLYCVSQVKGIGRREAVCMAEAMGALHAQHWSPEGRAGMPEWLSHVCDISIRDPDNKKCAPIYLQSKFVDPASCEARGVGGETLAAARRVMERGAELKAALSGPGPCTLLHNDARCDNVFWGDEGGVPGGVVFLDWQLLGCGPGPIDLAWATTNSITDAPPSEARDRVYVIKYWESLTSRGVDKRSYPFEACWRDYLLGVAWSYALLTHLAALGNAEEMLENELCRKIHDRCMTAVAALGVHEIAYERIVGST